MNYNFQESMLGAVAVDSQYTYSGHRPEPLTESKRKSLFGGVSTSLKDGGDQIEYANQSPRIQQLYEEATARSGVTPRMSAFS